MDPAREEEARPSATPWSSGTESGNEGRSVKAQLPQKKKRVRKVTYSSQLDVVAPPERESTNDSEDEAGVSGRFVASFDTQVAPPAAPGVALPPSETTNLRAETSLGVRTSGSARKKATKALLMTKAENAPPAANPGAIMAVGVSPGPGAPVQPTLPVVLPPIPPILSGVEAAPVAAAGVTLTTQKIKRAQRLERRGATQTPPVAVLLDVHPPADAVIVDKPGATRVVCVATCADNFDLAKAKESLECNFPLHSANNSIISTEDGAQVLHWTVPTRDWNADADVFVFEYGVVAFWGPNELALWHSVVKCLVPAAENYCFKEHNVEYLTWSYNKPGTAAGATSASESDFRTATEQQLFATRYSWLQQDHFYLATTEPDVKLAYSHAAAQSEKLSHYEDKIDQQIELTRRYPEELAESGEVALSAKDIAKTKGQLFVHRMNIILHTDLLDTPDYFWDRTDLEPLYHNARKYFEISRRVRVLNERLDVVAELFDMLHDQQKQKHSDRLEWIVIWLIAVEILVSVLTIYLKLYDEGLPALTSEPNAPP